MTSQSMYVIRIQNRRERGVHFARRVSQNDAATHTSQDDRMRMCPPQSLLSSMFGDPVPLPHLKFLGDDRYATISERE